MMTDNSKEIEMPADWPKNKIEEKLSRIHIYLIKFDNNPSYKIKDVIVSEVCDFDFNQISIKGMIRITDYSVALINDIYVRATFMHMYSVKLFIYRYIMLLVRTYKFTFDILPNKEIFKNFKGLNFELYLFYLIYKTYNSVKEKDFIDEFIGDFKDLIAENPDNIEDFTKAFVSVINNASYFSSKKIFPLFAFNRDEFKKIIAFISFLVKRCNYDVRKAPHKGILCTLISNYVLKSRNNYNEDYICKYMSESSADKSIKNHQIWLRKTELLNDKRESKVIKGIFANKKWIKYDWVKKLNLNPDRIYFVSSFCKNFNDETMKQEYGKCIYGYKNDKIAELISPIHYFKYEDLKLPTLSQVISFDVIYRENDIKEEINYLCDLIDLFDISDEDKNAFLDEILQYWILSVKDKKWEYEKERRYVLFLYDSYEYIEINDFNSDDFLKIKTSLLLYPDFILSKAKSMIALADGACEKRFTICQDKKYRFCENCLSFDFDNLYKDVRTCPICGSLEYYMFDERGEYVES